MAKSITEKLSRLYSSVIKASRTVNRVDKFRKDIKFTIGKRKSAKRKPAKRKHIPKAVRDAVFKRDNYRCVKCGSTQNLEIDHKVPLAKGRSGNKPEDLQVLCKDCNLRKGVS